MLVLVVLHADGVFERKAIRDFVFANKLPLIISFNKETAPQIFESDIKKQVRKLFFWQ